VDRSQTHTSRPISESWLAHHREGYRRVSALCPVVLLSQSVVAQLRQCTGARCRIRTIPTFQLGTRGVPSRSRISSASAPTLGAHRSSSLTPARPRLVLVSVLVPACGPCAVNSLRRLVRSALVCLCPSVCGRTRLCVLVSVRLWSDRTVLYACPVGAVGGYCAYPSAAHPTVECVGGVISLHPIQSLSLYILQRIQMSIRCC